MDFETRAAADRVKRLWGEFKLCLRNEVNARHALAPVGGLHARIGVREAEGAGPEAPPTFRLTIHRLTSAGEVFTPSICEALETALGMEKGEILSSSP